MTTGYQSSASGQSVELNQRAGWIYGVGVFDTTHLIEPQGKLKKES